MKGGASELFHMGASSGTSATSSHVGANELSSIGSKRTDDKYWDGGIAELFYYNKLLTSTERIIIDNYLSAKYGQSLDANDLYVADNPENGDYDHDVAGIGSDYTGVNAHTDAQGTGIVRILNPTNLQQNNFFFWGHDNGAINASNVVDYPSSEGVQGRLQRVWRVTKTGGDSIGFDIRFDLSSISGSKAAEDLVLLIDTDNDGVFSDETVSSGGLVMGATDVSDDIFQFSNVTALGNTGYEHLRFTLGTSDISTTVLPVELVSFSADIVKGGLVELNWMLASELDNDYFTIERSNDSKNWIEVEVIPGQGSSTVLTRYKVFDENAPDGVLYYRLKQTDFNGKYKYSYIVIVNQENENRLSVDIYPNPVNDVLFIDKISSETVSLTLKDALGNTLYESDMS